MAHSNSKSRILYLRFDDYSNTTLLTPTIIKKAIVNKTLIYEYVHLTDIVHHCV